MTLLFLINAQNLSNYHPRTVILNNLEFDHVDIFPDLSAIERQFHHLIRTVPNNGLIIQNAKDDNLVGTKSRRWTPIGGICWQHRLGFHCSAKS